MMPKKDNKLSWKRNVNASMASLVAVRSDAELCGCMIDAYRPFAKVVNNCIKYRLNVRSSVVCKLLEKFLLLCHSIKRDLPESDHEQNPLSYNKLASIFLSQFMNVTALLQDIDKQMKCSTASMHLFLILGSSVLHLIDALLNVNTDLLFNDTVSYFPLYKKIMEKCATTEMNVALYLRCIVLSIHWYKVLPKPLKQDVVACLNNIGTESISLIEIKAILKHDFPNGVDMNRLSVKLLKRLSDQGRIKLLKSFNNDAIESLNSAITSGVRSRANPKVTSSLPASEMFFTDRKADANMLRMFSKENVEEEEETGEEHDSEDEKIQRETDSLIAGINLKLPKHKNSPKRKKAHSEVTAGGKLKKKRMPVQSDEHSSDESQQDMNGDAQDDEELDSDATASEKSLESEKCTGENQAYARVTEISPARKTSARAWTVLSEKTSPSKHAKLLGSLETFKKSEQEEGDSDCSDNEMVVSESSLSGEEKFKKMQPCKNVAQPSITVAKHRTSSENAGVKSGHDRAEEVDQEAVESDSENCSESKEIFGKKQGCARVCMFDIETKKQMPSVEPVSEVKYDIASRKSAGCARVFTLDNINTLKKEMQPVHRGQRRTSESISPSKKKLDQFNSDLKNDEEQGGKDDTIELNVSSSDENVQDLTKVDCQDAEDDDSRDKLVSESPSISEERFEKIKTPEKVKKASIFDKKESESSETDITISKHSMERKEHEHEHNLPSSKDATPNSASKHASPHSNKKRSTTFTNGDCGNTPSKRKKLSMDDAVDAQFKAGNEGGRTNVDGKKASPAMEIQKSIKINIDRIDGKVNCSAIAVDEEGTSDSDPDEDIVCRLSTSLRFPSSSEEDKDSDNEAVKRKSLTNNSNSASKLLRSKIPFDDCNSDADSERSSIVSKASNDSPRRRSKDNASINGSDADDTVASFFIEEAGVDNRREEEMGSSDESDVNDFLNDESSESGDAESSSEHSSPERESGSFGLPRRLFEGKKFVEITTPKPESPTKSTRSLTSSGKLSKTPSLSPSSAKSDRVMSSTATRLTPPDPYVPLMDVKLILESDDDNMDIKSIAMEGDVQEKPHIDSDESNSEDEISKSSSLSSKSFKIPTSLRRSQRGKSAKKSGSNSDDNETIFPAKLIQQVAVTPSESNRRSRRIVNEAKTEPRKITTSKNCDDNEASSPSSQVQPDAATPSEISRRTRRIPNQAKTEPRKTGRGRNSDDKEKSSPSKPVDPVPATPSESNRRSRRTGIEAKTEPRKNRDGRSSDVDETSSPSSQARPVPSTPSESNRRTRRNGNEAKTEPRKIGTGRNNDEDKTSSPPKLVQPVPATPSELNRRSRRSGIEAKTEPRKIRTGPDSDGDEANSPSRQVQPVAATPTEFNRKTRRNFTEAKTEPRKIGRSIANEGAKTPVTKKGKFVAASAVATRVTKKMGITSDSDNDEDNAESLPVRKAKPSRPSKSPRMLRSVSGYTLRPRSTQTVYFGQVVPTNFNSKRF